MYGFGFRGRGDSEPNGRSLPAPGTHVMAESTQQLDGTFATTHRSIWTAVIGAADLNARDFSGRATR